MEQDKISTEAKAGIKLAGKFLYKMNPNTPYQEKLKRDIDYIDRSLELGKLEQLIRCNILITKDYSYFLVSKGFYKMNEAEIRNKGYNWNYDILNKIKKCLQKELLARNIQSSVKEALPKYVIDTLFKEE